MSKFNFSGSVSALGGVYTSLDNSFKDHIDGIIDTIHHGSCLLRLLRLTEKAHLLTFMLAELLDYYDMESNCFDFNGNQLHVTLEDVLFLTGLPITGKPVISSTSRDGQAFNRVFGSSCKGKMELCKLKKIVSDTVNSNSKRLVALLLLVIACFIMPSSDSFIRSHYVQFVENIESVNEYAWGAALLASLYRGIENPERKYTNGNPWVLLCFFCFRIPKLGDFVEFTPSANLQVPLLIEYMKKVERDSRNHRPTYLQQLKYLLSELQATDMKWHPYVSISLDESMQNELQHVTRLGPLFCQHHVAR